MLTCALVEIRALGYQGRLEQATDLADAFHNLPAHLWSEDFSFSFFRLFLQSYQQKYPEEVTFNYIAMLDGIAHESV